MPTPTRNEATDHGLGHPVPAPQPATAAQAGRRPVQRADIHIVDLTGADLFLDVRVTHVPADCLPQQHLQQTATRKAAEYACAGVTPVIFSTDGGYDAGTFVLVQRLLALRLRKLIVDSPEMDMLSLNQQVQQEFFEPISCILARNFAAAIAASLGDSKLQESAVKQVRARYQANAQPLALCVAADAAAPGQPASSTSASSSTFRPEGALAVSGG
eukprot:4133741-Amphidinium_carterae.1